MKFRLLSWACALMLSTPALAAVTVVPSAAPELVLQTGHQNAVYALAVAPSGKLFASGDDGGNVKIWTQLGDGVLFSLQPGAARVTALQFSADSARLLVTTEQNISLWELRNGTQLWAKNYSAQLAVFSHDGKSVIAYQWIDTRVEIEAATGKVINQIANRGFYRRGGDYVLSPDGKVLASDASERLPAGSGVSKPGLLLNAATGVLQHALRINGSIRQFAFSPSGQTLAVAVSVRQNTDENKSGAEVQLFNTKTGKLRRVWSTYKGANSRIESVAFSPDGKFLATTGEDGMRTGGVNALKIWDSQTGALLQSRLRGKDYRRSHAQFAPDGKSVLSILQGAHNYSIETWNWKTGRATQTDGILHEALSNPKFSPDGRFLLIQNYAHRGVGGSTVYILDSQSGVFSKPPWNLGPLTITTPFEYGSFRGTRMSYGPGGNINTWAFSPDGSTLVTSHPLQTWKWPSAERSTVAVPVPEPHVNESKLNERRLGSYINCLEVAPDSRTVAIGSVNGTPFYVSGPRQPTGELALWNIATNQSEVLQTGVDVRRVAFSPDGKRLAAFVTRLAEDSDQSAAEEIPKSPLDRHELKTTSSIEVWDVASRRLLKSRIQTQGQIQPHDGNENFVWLDDERLLVLQSRLGSTNNNEFNAEVSTPDLKAWNTTTDSVTSILNKEVKGKGIVVALTPRAIGVAQAGRVLWLSLPDGKSLGKSPILRPYQITDWALSPNRKFAVSTRGNGEMEYWDLKSGEKVATLAVLSADAPDKLPNWIFWTPDGFYDSSPGVKKWIRFRQNNKLLPVGNFASRRRPHLLRSIGISQKARTFD